MQWDTMKDFRSVGADYCVGRKLTWPNKMNMIVNYIVTVPFDGFNVHDFNASLSGNKTKITKKHTFTSTTVLQTDEKTYYLCSQLWNVYTLLQPHEHWLINTLTSVKKMLNPLFCTTEIKTHRSTVSVLRVHHLPYKWVSITFNVPNEANWCSA